MAASARHNSQLASTLVRRRFALAKCARVGTHPFCADKALGSPLRPSASLYPLRHEPYSQPGPTPRHRQRRRARAQPRPEPMVAPAMLSLRPCAAPAAPRARAWFAPAARGSPTAAVSYPARRPFSGLHRAVAVDSDQQGSAEPPEQEKKPKTYHFLVANAKFMLDEEEHFQEQLAEKLRLYGERGMEQDFWLVIEPKFLDRFPNITKRLKRPAVALVSTDANWMTFMKLRLDRVLQGQFDAESVEEALASNPVDLKFEKPEKWTAPYPKYEFGWWKPFLPPKSSNGTA